MSVELKTVKLYGHLGRKFGKTFQVAVSSPSEAIKALSVNIKGFKEYLLKHSAPGYHIFLDKRDLTKEELAYGYSNEVLKIVPVTLGSGGFFKVVIGAILVAVSFIPGMQWTASIGYTMIVSGVAEVLFAPPKPQFSTAEKPANTPSYIFNGPVNTTMQGNPVSLCYGRVRIGSQVISAGLSSREIPI